MRPLIQCETRPISVSELVMSIGRSAISVMTECYLRSVTQTKAERVKRIADVAAVGDRGGQVAGRRYVAKDDAYQCVERRRRVRIEADVDRRVVVTLVVWPSDRDRDEAFPGRRKCVCQLLLTHVCVGIECQQKDR